MPDMSRYPTEAGSAIRKRTERERGQVAIEYLGFLPLLLLVGLLAIQLGIAAYTANQAGTAARAAARAASVDDPKISPDQAARSAVSGWVARNMTPRSSYGDDQVTYTVRIKVPSLLPGVDWGTAERSSTMPRD
ncbi:TadE/TadG family type IV pilus assembly protein [Streptomyces sp. SCSIO 30461]|uniref:TadE/TadG family type IV pilus assembly protein n=1 Tax=Streptomyces sp. SCSIO 30461 TaxID=3118085 RepID=UPI0030D0B6ED